MHEPWWISLIKAGIIVNLVLGLFAYLTLIERKVMGRMQLRYGPNRAGPYGLLQPIADLVKLVRKEAFAPAGALGIVLLGRSLSLPEIVARQGDVLPFVVPQFVGMVIFFIGGIAETSRAPFDLPEAEQELVAGYHTEYSGMRWGLFQMAEYINLITLSALMVTLFFSGWHGPWSLGPLWFVLKLLGVLFVFIWLRTTLPRLRYD